MKKRAIVYVGETEKEKRRNVSQTASKVLATYPDSVLVEVDEDQISSLKSQGLRLEKQEKPYVIRLRAVEFDTAKEAPGRPPTLKVSAAEIEKIGRNYWIVQFVGPVKPEWGEKIKALGGKLHSHIPENAVLVSMAPQIKEKIQELPFVNWVGLYEPAYKVSPLLTGRRKKFAPNELATLSVKPKDFKPTPKGNITIMIHDTADLETISEKIEELGGTVITKEKDILRVSLDLSNMDTVAKIVEVKWIEPYALPELFNEVAADIMNVQPVWHDFGLDGRKQIIAVADTGLDTGANNESMHEDFKGKILNIHSWKIPRGLRPYLDNSRWDDGGADVDSGHGTHVAGSVLGNGSKSSGLIRGIAFGATLVFQAVEQWTDWNPETERRYSLDDGYYLLGIPDDLTSLFQQAYEEGARIHTNSWGDREHGQYTTKTRDIDKFVWDHKDMVILFAAGNDGRDDNRDGLVDKDSLSSQSCAKNCISVGASESYRHSGGYQGTYGAFNNPPDIPFPKNPILDDRLSDNPEGLAAFSSRGPSDDGRIKPDVVAPGTNILSTRSSKASGKGWGLLEPDDLNHPYYLYMGGTSMATPLTAGAAALIRQYLIEKCEHKTPSAALVKAILIHGATPLPGQYTPPEIGNIPDYNQGWGRVNLANSLYPPYPVKMEFRDSTDKLGTGEHKTFTFRIGDNTVPFKATMVWTDYPSDPETGGELVNVLRLSVILRGREPVYGVPAKNNVQQVTIKNPPVGQYTVRVEGINIGTLVITGERQDFALVVSGGMLKSV